MNPISSAFAVFLTLHLWAAPPREEGACDGYLNPTSNPIVLPRELKVSPEAIQFFLSDERSGPLVRALSDLFRRLSPEVLTHLAREITDTTDWKHLLDQNAFFKDYPELLVPGVEENAPLLSRLPLDESLSDYERGLLCYLLRELPHQPRPLSVTLTLKSERKNVPRMKVLLAKRIYREAFAKLLSLETVRTSFLAVWNTMDSRRAKWEARPNRPLNFQDVNDLKRRLVTDTVKERDIRPLTNFLEAFIALELLAKSDAKVHSLQSSEDDLSLTVERQGLLELMEEYLAEHWQMKSSLQDAIDAIDYFLIGTPLPLEAAELNRMIVKAADELLTPYKRNFAQAKAQTPTPPPAAAPPQAAEFAVRLIDRFSPRPERGSHKRRRPTGEQKGYGTAEPPRENEDASPESLSGGEDSLRVFTSYASTPQPIRLLESLKTYRFWFLREATPIAQRVRFSTEAVNWLKSNPEGARKLLNALHLGEGNRSGVKDLEIRSRQYPGRLFELKASGPWRGLMVYVENTWEVLAIVHKDQLNRTAEWLSPLSRGAD